MILRNANVSTLLFLILFSVAMQCSKANKPANTGNAVIDSAAVLRYRLDGDPPTLDPAHCTDTRSAAVVLKIFDGLVQFDPVTLKILPAAAKRWTISPDGLTYEFILRDNAFFHHGRKVLASDFQYSFERLLNPKTASERAWVLAPLLGAENFNQGKAKTVTGIIVQNDTTLILRLAKPFGPFLGQLCMEAASALPKETQENGSFPEHPVGCGPFRFISAVRGSEINLRRFDPYYGDPVQVAGIQYKILPSAEVAFQQYRSGELDFLDEIPQGRMDYLKKQMPEDLFQWPILGIYYLGFNLAKPPFKDNRLLRQAMAHAIRREEICQVIFENAAQPAKGILPPGIDGYDSTAPGYPFDLAKAKRLMAQAGYPEGNGLAPLDLWFNQNERHRRVAQYIQSLLGQIGITIRLRELEWGTYLQALQAGEASFFRLGWVADLPDADNFLYPLLHSSQIGKGDNYSRFANATFDSLVEAARKTHETKEREDFYRQADRLAMEQCVWVMIAYNEDVCLLKPQWKGLELSRQGDFAIPLEKLTKYGRGR